MSTRVHPVVYADEQVPISLACRLIGMQVPEAVDAGRSVKLRCPFGEIYHSDRGSETAMRIYPESNHAFCFACGQRYGPVRLLVQAWGIAPRQAALELLDRAGLKPAALADLWAHAADRTQPPDTTLLAEALKTYCARVAGDWELDQFEPEVAGMLTRCLSLLDQVGTAGDAVFWLERAKRIMHARLQTVYDSQDSGL